MPDGNKTSSIDARVLPIRWLFGVFVIAFLIRLLYLYTIRKEPLFFTPMMDASYYYDWAKRLYQGTPSNDIFYLNPGFAYLLAAFMSFVGEKVTSLIIIQNIISSLGCVLGTLLAHRFFKDIRISVFTGILYALYGYDVFYTQTLLTAIVINVINLTVLLLLMYKTKKTGMKYISVGGCIGLSVLFRPTAYIFIPLVIAWVFFEESDGVTYKEKPAKKIIYAAIGLSLMLLPVSIRNYMVARQFVITSTSFGINFFIGNNPRSTGLYTPSSFEENNPFTQQESYRQEAYRKTGTLLSMDKVSSYWTHTAIAHIKQNPLWWAHLLKDKFLLFWNSKEAFTNVYNWDYFLNRSRMLKALSFIGPGVIIPFGLLGISILFIERKNNRSSELGVLYIVGYMLVNMLFFVTSEYRYPIVPLLLIFSAYALISILEKTKNRNVSRTGIYVLIFFLVFVITYRKLPAMQGSENNPVDFANRAFVLAKNHKYEEARRWCNKAIELAPEYTESYIILGKMLYDEGKFKEAAIQFKKAIEQKANYIRGYYWLGKAYVMARDLGEAKKIYLKILSIDPQQQEAQNTIQQIDKYLNETGK